jgi:hypothetical protein
MFYRDPYQDLTIAIQPGFQYLDGEAAEGLVRFRTYRDGDLQRIKVQHDFMMALFSQVLERENIVGNALSVAKNLIGHTETNFGVTDIPKYLRYINDLSPNNINFYTLPNVPQYINGISYVIPIKDEIEELVKKVFYTISVPEAESNVEPVSMSNNQPTPIPVISSRGMRIQVLNGSKRTGLAGVFKEALENDGFTVTNIDTFTGAQMEETQIIVRKAGMGPDLERYFKNTIIQVAPNMPANYDIIIITGLGEA